MEVGFFDLILLIIGALIVLIASFRGFVAEFFSVINWILSFTLSLLLAPFTIFIFPDVDAFNPLVVVELVGVLFP